MTRLSHKVHGEIIVPLQQTNFDPLQWPKAGAFPLFPYHGRLAGACFEHEGRRIELQPNSFLGTDSMHGPAHQRPWQITEMSRQELILTLDYKADADWPFDFHAKQRFYVGDEGLAVDLQLANSGKVAMPAGIGWHPYFVSTSDSLICCDAAERWMRRTPHTAFVAPHRRDPASGHLENAAFTEHLAAWSEASISSEEQKVHLARVSGFPFLVAHRTLGYVCLEPVSHVAGAFALPEQLRQEAGLLVLKPHETIQGSIALLVG